MIRNQWYVVLESKEVRKKPIGVTRMGEKLVFWRNEAGNIHCAVDRCPHRGVALSIGKLEHDHLQCPFHGFEYDASGRCVHIPANGRGGRIPKSLQLQNYPTFEEHGFIWIWWGDSPPEELQPPIFFDNLDDILCLWLQTRSLEGTLFTGYRESIGCGPPAFCTSQYHRARQ